MRVPHYTVGSAAALTLSRLEHLRRRESPLSVDDLIKIARFNAGEAHALFATDPATARDFLLNGASRMIRAAEQLEQDVAAAHRPAAVMPLRAVS
ncbi:hypothetical protein [Sphingobium lactosutens]|uniref:Uncharacterized protein n=1 Tax=Sphingobium lactosutens DS20 TaxID=1331060 RepID=T0HAB3_9SPHN|nr:hypothetical protein [Sphingobium lactosutens]EQB13261.1 hypothetical protein RLDS_16115 [Sphingobium lactosutens DS20]